MCRASDAELTGTMQVVAASRHCEKPSPESGTGPFINRREITMAVANVTEGDFRKRVLNSPLPVLLACRASWCVPSQQLAPIIDQIEADFRGKLNCVAVQMDDLKASRVARRFKVTRLPITMLIDQGRVVDTIGGWTSKDVITEMVSRRLSPVLQVDEFNFDDEVLSSSIPVLVHFDAAWCSPSRDLVPILDDVARKFAKRAKIVRMNFGPETARTCARYGVTRVPTLALFVDGQIEDRILGGMVGGTKVGDVRSSCVGLTTFDNIAEMLEPFAL